MKIVKTAVQANIRALSATWTEEHQVIKNEIGDEFAKILQEQINKEILLEVKAEGLVKQGWIKIPFTVKTSIDWFKENIKDEYAMILGATYFKSQEDAVFYTLTWSNHEADYSSFF